LEFPQERISFEVSGGDISGQIDMIQSHFRGMVEIDVTQLLVEAIHQ
jgi:hypothetical protein